MVEATVAKERVAARVAEMRASVNAGEKRMAAEMAAAAMELAARAVAAEAWVAAVLVAMREEIRRHQEGHAPVARHGGACAPPRTWSPTRTGALRDCPHSSR
jgi:hypothetical protein